MKKLLAIIMIFITVFLCSCSKESKFGVQQFVERMSETFTADYTTNEFMLSEKNGENFLFLTRGKNMITLLLDNNNNIKGISLLITADSNIENAKELYCQMCSIFTDNDYKTQLKIFNDSDFFCKDIKFADGNSIITVGRYKYTIVSNSYAITFFCDKI
jgi:hypothetical protein